jgi:hypothetical protein
MTIKTEHFKVVPLPFFCFALLIKWYFVPLDFLPLFPLPCSFCWWKKCKHFLPELFRTSKDSPLQRVFKCVFKCFFQSIKA